MTDTTMRVSYDNRDHLKRLKGELGSTQDAVLAELLRRYEEGTLGEVTHDLRDTTWVDGGEENGEFQVTAVRTAGRDPVVELDDGREFTAAEFDALRRLGVVRPAE